MNLNLLAIFLIFIIFITLILSTQKFNINNIDNDNLIENFYLDNLNIDTDVNNYVIDHNNFSNELIPNKKEFNYINNKIITVQPDKKPGIEIIKNYNNNYDLLNCYNFNDDHIDFNEVDKSYYNKYQSKKNNSTTDLPIANTHIQFLLTNNKISNCN